MYSPMYHLRPLWPWQTPFFEELELLSNKTTTVNGALQIVQLLLFLTLTKKVIYKLNVEIMEFYYHQKLRENNFFIKKIYPKLIWRKKIAWQRISTLCHSATKHDHDSCGKIIIFSVKLTFLLNKLLKSWFHEIFWAFYGTFPHSECWNLWIFLLLRVYVKSCRIPKIVI